MENKLPSRERIRAVLDEGLGIDVETLVDIGQAYADGRLIEPMSREELAIKSQRIIEEWHERLNGIEVLEDDLAFYRKEIGIAIADALLRQVGKVQEDISNSMLRRFRVQHGLDIVTGKPHVELTEEDVTKIIKDNMHYYEDADCHSGLGRVAQEIVRAMKGVK